MELIQPAEISGKIMTLIDQAKKDIIIVSPYNKFTFWKKLTQRIYKAKQRGVDIKWYIRKNVEGGVEQIREIGIEPIEVENLHCKIYLNERHAVVTSMNLHEYSDSSSIDIGYLITEEDKYKELVEFIDAYIDSSLVGGSNPIEKNNSVVADNNLNFTDLAVSFFLDSGFDKEKIKIHKNRYGTVIKIIDFVDNFELILEPKNSYYRIDLRINYPYNVKCDIFEFIRNNESELNKQIGFEIDFGSQMKRLKLDLRIFEKYEYENWGITEFEILKPILINVLATYKTYINNAVKHAI